MFLPRRVFLLDNIDHRTAQNLEPADSSCHREESCLCSPYSNPEELPLKKTNFETQTLPFSSLIIEIIRSQKLAKYINSSGITDFVCEYVVTPLWLKHL